MAGSEFAVVEATEAHARELAPQLRRQDLVEIAASCGMEPLDALLMSLRVSVYRHAMLFGGKVGAIWGVSLTGHPEVGCAWLLGSEEIRANARAFLAICRPEIRSMLAVRPVLTNWVDQRNAVSLRWLKRLGAEFGTPRPYGVAGLPFVPFVLR